MANLETVGPREFEGIVSKVESKVRSREPLEFTPDDAKLLKSSFEGAGIRFYTGKEADLRLMRASMLRTKAILGENGKVSGVSVYDYDKPKGQRWTDIQKFNPESFSGKNFRDDRTMALYEMLGEEKFRELIKWSYDQANKYPGKIGGHEGTQGRGLLQATADLLAILREQGESKLTEIYVSRLNSRLWKGFRKTLEGEELKRVDAKFSDAGVDEPSKNLASYPPDSLPKLVRFLAAKPGD